MATSLQDGEYYSLSRLDVRVLIVLLKGQMNAYEIGRQCEADNGRDIQVRNNALYHSLKSLELYSFIKTVETAGNTKVKRLYDITSSGRMVLEWEVKSLKHLLELAEKRS